MKRLTRQPTRWGNLLLLTLLCWGNDLLAAPRPPLPPWPEFSLFRWQFDEPYAIQSKNNEAKTVDASIWVESWSGYALNRQGRQVKHIELPLQSTNGYNFVASQGTIRVWFSPSWRTGKGPGHDAPLLEMVTAHAKENATWWSLQVNPEGTALILSAQTDAGWVDLLKTPINWQAGQWHLISLAYSPSNTVLSIDAQAVAIGEGLVAIPDELRTLSSLIIGSSFQGQSAEGQFEELTTFTYAYPDWLLAFYYAGNRRQADLGPISSLETERTRLQAEQAQLAALQLESLGGGGFSLMMAESGLRLTLPKIPSTNTSIAFLTLLEADTNKSYDVYFVPALGLTNTAWNIIAAQGTQGQTNFTVPATNWMGFFRAFEGNDWDNDGVLNYMDANPTSSGIGALTVTIEAPANSSTVD